MRSRNGLFALGALTALPLAYLVAVMVFVAVDAGTTPADLLARFGWRPLLLPNIAVFLMIVGLMCWYVGDLLQTPAITEDRKPLWATVMVVGHVFAMAAYWLLYLYLPWRAECRAMVRAPVAPIRRPVPMTPSRASPARRRRVLETADHEH